MIAIEYLCEREIERLNDLRDFLVAEFDIEMGENLYRGYLDQVGIIDEEE